MKIIGITGGIASGKSTLAMQLQALGVPVYSADVIVHTLLGPKGKAVKKVAELFPGTLQKNAIDRKALGKIVFANTAALIELESVLHPLVRAEEMRLVKAAKKAKLPIIGFEIPLLFETGAEAWLDVVITTKVKKAVQHKRAMQRKHLTAKQLQQVLKRQMTDAERAKRADYVIETDRGKAFAKRELKKIVESL